MILVTGATGLVGSHVLINLLKEGQQVRAMSRQAKPPQVLSNLFEFYGLSDAEISQMEWYQGDITDITSIENAFEGVTHVYHCAALVSFLKSDLKKLQDINIEGTTNMVNLCIANQITKLCYVSSTAAINAKGDEKILTEDGDWVRDMKSTAYSKSKFLAEREVWRCQEEGIDTVIVNPCVIIGPGDWNLSSNTLFKTVAKGLKFYSPGSNAFVDVRDVAENMIRLMKSDITADRFLLIGENLSFKDLLTKIANALGVRPPSIAASKFLIGIGWRLDGLLSFLRLRKRSLSKEMAKNSIRDIKYSNAKAKERLGVEFRKISDSAEFFSGFYKKYYF